jgi:hypothetical protein
MRDAPGPVLELFDLGDANASPKAQLAQRADPKNAEQFTIPAVMILVYSRSGPHVVCCRRQSQD